MTVNRHPVGADLRARLRPSPEQTAVATAMLSVPGVIGVDLCVLVPIALPGKQYGVWETGQPVEHPNGFWLADAHHGDDTRWPYRDARDAASRAAHEYLGPRRGSIAYAIIRPGDDFIVFEDMRTVWEKR